MPAPAPTTLEALNAADRDGFVRLIGDAFEHAPWIAEKAAARRPFATVAALHEAMFAEVGSAPRETQLAFIGNHPELAGQEAVAGTMTLDSVSEQGSAGLDRLSPSEFERLGALNRAYRARFGFPFVVCVRHYTRAALLREFERRLDRSPEEEMEAALGQIRAITRLRIAGRVEGPGRPHTDGRLSTHVLDTVAGRPAAGVLIALRDLSDGGAGIVMRETHTNAEGRTDQPLIGGQPLRIGTYELAFHVGPYFAREPGGAEPAFLDIVPVRFSIAEPAAHYHVPLLVTPWSYATYRGS